MAGVGNRLEEGYVPRPNDGNVLAAVVDRIRGLLDQVENLITEIKAHDQSLFDTNGRTLKHKWQMFHHISNSRLIELLSDMRKEMTSLVSKAEVVAKTFITVFQNKSGLKNIASKKKKTNKKIKTGKQRGFKRIWSRLSIIISPKKAERCTKKGTLFTTLI